MRELVTTPDATVPYVSRNLEAARAVDRQTLSRLVQQLDDENQTARDEATRQLIALDEQARSAVEAAQKSPSAEVRKRVGQILERLEQGAVGQDARPLRAVEVLEVIGTPAARDVLKRWAAGPPGTRLTTEAAAALARLKP